MPIYPPCAQLPLSTQFLRSYYPPIINPMPSLSLVASLRGHSGVVWSVAWSPLGLLASCGTDRMIRIWHPSSDNTDEWKCTVAFNNDTFLRTVRDLSWSSDGRSLACACFDAVTFVLELIGGKEPRLEAAVSLEGHDSEVKGVSYSSGGALMASCSRDRSVWIWEAGLDFEYECIAVLNGHTADIKSVVWHPRIELLISCSYDGTMRVWVEDDDDWFCAETLAAHSGTVWSAAFDACGTGLVSVAEDGGLVVWNREDPPGRAIGAHPCFKVVARMEQVHAGPVYCVDWNKTSSLIATGGEDDAINIVRKVEAKGSTVRSMEGNSGLTRNAPVSNEISIDATEEPPTSVNDTTLSDSFDVQQTVTSKLTQQYEVITSMPRAHTGDVNRVAWNPVDSNLLASCGDDGLVRIWRYSEDDVLRLDT